MKGKVKDSKLAPEGNKKITWAKNFMNVVNKLSQQLEKEKPFSGLNIGVSIHLEAKTARLAIALRDAGAEVFITSSNPLSTQDDVAAALNEQDGITVFAERGVTEDEYKNQIKQVLQAGPQVIIDDGGDLVGQLHSSSAPEREEIIGGCEETTTGIHRLEVLEKKDQLRFPMYAVNDARMKYLFDNRYGTGQSTWDAIMRTTNLSVAGSTAVVVGYGWCGKGVAKRASGLGADVIVVEVDPVKAIEAKMDGFGIASIEEAAPQGDFLVTTTGCIKAIPEKALEKLKDGAILANAGHFNVEIDLDALERMSKTKAKVRKNVTQFKAKSGRDIYLLAEGRLVNLVAGDGHPIEIMDISFALQLLTSKYLVDHQGELKAKLYSVPREVDEQVARHKLESMGVDLKPLTKEQQNYLENWH